MPRQKSTKPTLIYWLWDVRPETIAAGYSKGQPFYCGKTVGKPERRLQGHRTKPHGNVGIRVLECGEYIRIQTMEIVPVECDWVARERYWISVLRLLWPNTANIADGGAGPAGWIPNAKQLAKWRTRKHSDATRAKIGAASRGKKQSPEQIAKRVAANIGYKHSFESRAKISAARQGKKLSIEHRMKLSALQKGRVGKSHTLETRAKISTAKKNPSVETRAKLSAAQRGKKLSFEHIAKMREGYRRHYDRLIAMTDGDYVLSEAA